MNAELLQWYADKVHELTARLGAAEGGLAAATAERDRLRDELAALRRLTGAFCDQPDDRMYHAADGTWWKRRGDALVSADPPAEAVAPKAARAENASLRNKLAAIRSVLNA